MRSGAVVLALALALAPATGLQAYQTYSVQAGRKVVPLKWNRLPVSYYITDRGVSGVSATDLQAAVGRAFATWQGVQTAGVSAQFSGFTRAEPFDEDGQSTIGFASHPELDRVLGETTWLVDDVTGEIVESDIFLNSSFPWSVSADGTAHRYDVESIALHEIGHFFGLGHSDLGESELQPDGSRLVVASGAVMFPIAFSAGNVKGRTPFPDDIAGLSSLYPKGSFSATTGTINGRVTKNGQGVFGAHVVAFNPRTGKMVGNFSVDKQGRFSIAGLDGGAYVLRAEPVDDADLDSFFDDPTAADVSFKIAFYSQLAVTPPGGSSEQVEIKVTPK